MHFKQFTKIYCGCRALLTAKKKSSFGFIVFLQYNKLQITDRLACSPPTSTRPGLNPPVLLAVCVECRFSPYGFSLSARVPSHSPKKHASKLTQVFVRCCEGVDGVLKCCKVL